MLILLLAFRILSSWLGYAMSFSSTEPSLA